MPSALRLTGSVEETGCISHTDKVSHFAAQIAVWMNSLVSDRPATALEFFP